MSKVKLPNPWKPRSFILQMILVLVAAAVLISGLMGLGLWASINGYGRQATIAFFVVLAIFGSLGVAWIEKGERDTEREKIIREQNRERARNG